MMQQVKRPILLASFALLIGACSPDDSQRSLSPEAANLPTPATLPDAGEFAHHLPAQAFMQLSTAVKEAEALNNSIEALLTTPSSQSDTALHQVREHWRLSYSAYLAALASARLPVSEPHEWHAARLTRSHLTKQLNSWPIQPGYIDYLDGYPFSGIVNDTTLTLSAESITDQHKFSDASYVSLGYPAIEFMLWGENGERSGRDFASASALFDEAVTHGVGIDGAALDKTASADEAIPINEGTGERRDEGPGINILETQPAHAIEPPALKIKNQIRRGEYLRIISQLLLQQLQRLQLRWEPVNGYYASKVSEVSPEKILQASLMTVQQLIQDELLDHYLKNDGSSTFSAGNSTDLAALLSGLRELFLPQNTSAGLAPLLATSEHTVENINHTSSEEDVADSTQDASEPHSSTLARLQTGLAQDSACGTDWQLAASHTSGREACRQQLLELLATIEEVSTQLGMGLNTSH